MRDVVVVLTSLGVTELVAAALAVNYSEQRIRSQIAMLEYRNYDDPAAVLVKAIRENWAPPNGYMTPEQLEAAAQEAERQETEATARRTAAAAISVGAAAVEEDAPAQVSSFQPFQTKLLDSQKVWAIALMDLKGQDGTGGYLAGTRLLKRDGDELIVGAASSYAAEWLQRRLARQTQRVLSSIGGELVDVRFVYDAGRRG